VSKAAIDGIARQQGALGIDIGASEEAPVEPALEEASAEPKPAASGEGAEGSANA
jgi:small subunit ribosomal protein S2